MKSHGDETSRFTKIVVGGFSPPDKQRGQFFYLYGTPTGGEDPDDDEDEPGDASPTASTLGADAGSAPQLDQHGHVEDAYQHEGQHVACEEEGHLVGRPVVLRQDPAGRQVLRRTVSLLEHEANLRTRGLRRGTRVRSGDRASRGSHLVCLPRRG